MPETFYLYFATIVLGIVEGLTEFIPVSSTGHLIVADRLLDAALPNSDVMIVFIQLGAILAVIVARFSRLMALARDFFVGGPDRALALNILIAFLPAAFVGALAHDGIKAALFSPLVVALSLILGGVLMLIIERRAPAPDIDRIERLSLRRSFQIGLCQLAALIPGVSRAGASIVGAQFLGVERRAATEFSFFLAIPTILGAAAYDLYKSWADLAPTAMPFFAVGTLVAFAAAWVVIRVLIDFVGRHGFAPFAYYRMGFGALLLGMIGLGWL